MGQNTGMVKSIIFIENFTFFVLEKDVGNKK